MNAYIPLELILKNILHVISPSGEDWSTRALVIAELRAVVQSLESFRGATVEPYGSFVSNLFARCADLDISIELTNGAYLVSAGKKHKQNLLREVQKALRRRGGWRKLQFVPNARVPILKFESNSLNISCDVSINNLIGQMKSKLLFWINEIDGRFRDMVLLVKEWAKTHDINDSKSGTLNSYSLCLLIIFHFQTCAPALLPPLKEIYPGNMVDDLIGVRATAERRIEEICGENIHKFRSEKSRKRNQSSLSELFVSFLAKFSDISSRALEQGICLYTGQWEQIDRNMRWLPKTYALFVEDPFEQPGNTARTVSHRHLITISEAFRETHRMLISGNQNPSSLIGILVRPQVSQFIYRTPSSPNGYSSGHRGNCPPVHRAVHSPSQVQHQFQSQRVDRPPSNATMPRSVNIPRNQAQQAWRPRSDR